MDKIPITTLTGIGDIITLSGNSGNANAGFTPAAGVPEPTTFALFGAGLAVFSRLRRR